MTRQRKVLSLLVAGVVVLVSVALWRFRGVGDYSPPDGGVELTFSTDMAMLSGTLHLPEGDSSAPVVLFVHGDGPQDRYSGSGYNPMINMLVEDGIGVFSWDKAGIGESTGNWLDQDMADRAAEALAALDAVRSATDNSNESIGFLGFSQAGWVLPKIAAQTGDSTYFVIVGGATNWQNQGDYFTRIRLEREGAAQAMVDSEIESGRIDSAAFLGPPADYASYIRSTDPDDAMSAERFSFVARNYLVDSINELAVVAAPMLAIWGARDLNVDAKAEAQIYEQALVGGHENSAVVVWPDATHGLLRADKYNYQMSSEWPLLREIEAFGQGRRIHAAGSIDYIAEWIHQNS